MPASSGTDSTKFILLSRSKSESWADQDVLIFSPTSEVTCTKPFENIFGKLNLPKLGIDDLAIGDFNGDLMPDLFMVRAGPFSNPLQDDRLYLNTGDGFRDSTSTAGFSNPTICRSVAAGDFDNDMDLDIYLVCSLWVENWEIVSQSNNLPNILYENLGNGTFLEVPNAGGAKGTTEGNGETVSMADFDNDGFLDLFITNTNRKVGPIQLFKNVGNSNHWLEIDLVGTISNRDGIGSRIFISTDNNTQLREHTAGIHTRTQNHQRIHVGLGENTLVDSVVIFWPSGIAQIVQNIASDQILKIIEPEEPAPPKHQLKIGVSPEQILCKSGFELIFKSSTDMPACVKSSTQISLISRGWAIS